MPGTPRPGLWTRLRRRAPRHRWLHWAGLDCGHDEGLRALEVVTSLQHGGAERIAWELHRLLPEHGVATRLVVLGSPLRREMARPTGLADLSCLSRTRRGEAMCEIAWQFGADVLHGHLIDAEDTRCFAKILPVALTVHNTAQAWPEGLASLREGDCDLLIACALAVGRELRAAIPCLPVRTVWNGIDVKRFTARAAMPAAGEILTLVCVANPRPQKRLHLLPAILATTRDAWARRGGGATRLIIAGEVSGRSAAAQACFGAVNEAAERHGVASSITWTQGGREVAEVLAEAHVMVSCSAHEGLSLAHLEGLAAGLPLVATDAGGTREIAWRNAAVTLLSLDADPDAFAQAIIKACQQPAAEGREGVGRDFSAMQMARRTAWLLRSVVAKRTRGECVWFITNNLSTGGAQSSLRRLAKAFHADGIPVRVALLQEHGAHPTTGREDLIKAGIPVIVPPPAGAVAPDAAVAQILGEMLTAAPRSVCFWNAIPIYKILLADALVGVPVFDVSPGEMFFASLELYFAHPHPALPYRHARDYGELLAGVVVKFAGEASLARETLGLATQVIPNGVPLPPPRPQRSPGDVIVLGTAARISPQKRLEDLLEAFRLALPELPRCVLRIAGGVDPGSDDYAATLRDSAGTLPVEWLGDTRDMEAFHRSLDLFVMISEPAGCPNASLEAMAAGLPVIATDVGGAGEQVVDGITGRLVPPQDAALLAAAMIELCQDAEKRERMGAAGRQRIEDHFSMSRMQQAYRYLLLG